MGMNIFLNGKKEEVKEGVSISELLQLKKIRPEVVTVEVNEKIIDRKDFSKIYLKENDKLEFVFFMGGGRGD